MKVSQLRELLNSTEQLYLGAGNTSVAESLNKISQLCAGYESMTVPSFVKLIAKVSEDATN